MTIKLNSIKGANPSVETIKIKTIPEFKNISPTQPLTHLHYIVGNLICAGIVATFLVLLLFHYDVPNYLVGLVGSVIGYYIARAPYDL